MRWSLDELFVSFDSPEFTNAMEKLDEFIEKINGWVRVNLTDSSNSVKKLEEYLKLINEFYDHLILINTYTRLTISVDTANEKALQLSEIVDNKLNELTEATVKFKRWVGGLANLDEVISSSEYLTRHQFYLKEIARESKYLLSEKEEVVISKLSNTGSTAWTRLYNKLVSTLTVEINLDGEQKELPLPVVRNLAYHADKEIRKSAYEAELKAYSKIEESIAACLNGIKGEVLTVTELRGYESPLEEILRISRMERKTLETMFEAVREKLPVFRKYYQKKAELLGYEGGLPFYDLFAPMGNVEKEYSYEDAREFIVKNFGTFSNRLATFANNAFMKRWIDAEPRKGKRGGAFCTSIHPLKECRILTNFNGSFGNVTTLAHELGHGYHGSCLAEETFLNSRYPLPLAETASIFAETLVVNAALKEATEEEAFGILESSLSSAGQIVVDIYSRFLFEDELFRRRRESSLSVNELKNLMLWAQKEAYGDGLDKEILHPYMWINKPHYYSAERNYYNFPYTFGLLFAKGLYSEYLKRGEAFVAVYDELLRATGNRDIVKAAEMVGIDVNSRDFWRSSLDLIEEDINKFIELADRLNK